MLHNLKVAFRMLAKNPFVTLVAVVSLALGIGANAAIFSLFEEVVLRTLPVPEPERLVFFEAPGPKQGSTSCNQAGSCDAIFSHPMFRDLEAVRPSPFEGIAGHFQQGVNLSLGEETIRATAEFVSGSYFPVLGIEAAVGRLLGPSDDRAPGAHPVAVLSHGYWSGRLASNPSVVGRTIRVNGEPFTVVGVAAEGFRGTTIGVRPEVYLPMRMRAVVDDGYAGLENRRVYSIYLFGRLADGVALDRAEAEITAPYQRILTEVEAPLQEGMTAETLERFRQKEVLLVDGARGRSSIRQEAGTPITLLLIVAGLVLLIACANIANLLLARSASRRQEMAIRGALGAGRIRILGQVLTEAMVLAVLGGIASLVVGWWTLDVMASNMPPEVTQGLDFELNASAVLFTALVAVAAGLVFGGYPALFAARRGHGATLRSGGGHASDGKGAQRFRNALITVQIALCIVLLVDAGLFIRSLVNIGSVELGVRTEGVVTFGVAPGRNAYEPEEQRVFFERLEDELAALPGVTGVSSARVPILAGSRSRTSLVVEGYEAAPDEEMVTDFNWVGPDFFRILDVPVLAGREFTEADDADAPPVVVVNQSFAERYGLEGAGGVGRRVGFGNADAPDRQIVGVVPDTKYDEVKEDARPMAYIPYRQREDIGTLSFYARVAGDPAPVMSSIRPLVRNLDPNLPVEELKTLDRQVEETVVTDRVMGGFSAALAILATLLSAVGLYGVLAYTVAQRTREIGVRVALGADRSRILGLVLGRVSRQMIVGGIIGIVFALLLGRAVQSLLYQVDGIDPLSIGAAVALLGTVALVAAYLPARRANRVDPVEALRWE